MRSIGVIALAWFCVLNVSSARGECPPGSGGTETVTKLHGEVSAACNQVPATPQPQPQPAADPLATARWMNGSPECSTQTDPPIQVVRVDADTYAMRGNMCLDYEAPFMYLYCGTGKCVLMDSGAVHDERQFPLRGTIDRILRERAAETGRPEPELIIAHTHAHGDHTAGDHQFVNRPNTRIVGHRPRDVQRFFGIPAWPNGEANFDLGGRSLTVFPIPGHEASSIAVYDSRTRDLVTGDSLYPGRLYVSDQAQYRASVARLDRFVTQHPVRHVLGAHIECAADHSATRRHDYHVGAIHHPNEHGLLLGPEHVHELHRVVNGTPPNQPLQEVVRDHFILSP